MTLEQVRSIWRGPSRVVDSAGVHDTSKRQTSIVSASFRPRKASASASVCDQRHARHLSPTPLSAKSTNSVHTLAVDIDVDTRVDSTTVRVDTPTPPEERRRAYKREWMRAKRGAPSTTLLSSLYR